MAVSLRLVILGSAPGPERACLLTGQDVVVGRDPRCDLVLVEPTVSGRHGHLRPGPSGYVYTDLGSRNGSAVQRGEAVQPARPGEPIPLAADDVLLLGASDGPVRIRVEAAGAPWGEVHASGRTVVAAAPLADFGRAPPGDLVAFAARVLAAGDAEALAAAALAQVRALFPAAAGCGAQVAGAGFAAAAGLPIPGPIADLATGLTEARIVRDDAAGSGTAAVVPLLAAGSWHGTLASWSDDPGAIPEGVLGSLSVAATLLGLAAASLAVRREGEEALGRLEAEVARLGGAPGGAAEAVEPVGTSPAFVAAVSLCRAVASTDVPLLLQGETGTGKEILARAIHRWSRRSARAFVAINCAALPESLLESELFGHVRGAFTGAASDRRGLFEEADGGTIFLDEIGEMPAVLQAKFLRVLQDGEVRRVGANRPTRVDVRVLSATNRDLRQEVAAGRFREDLTYRLNAVTVVVPPLRERPEDVPVLAHHLLGRVCRRLGKRMPGFAPGALSELASRPLRGNVRELENEITRAVALTPEGHPVEAAAFSVAPDRPVALPGGTAPVEGTPLFAAVEQTERRIVEAVLRKANGNMSRAARELGMSRPGLYKALERLGIHRDGTDEKG